MSPVSRAGQHRGTEVLIALATLGSVVAVGAIILWPYVSTGKPPLSFDSYYYIWRTRFVAARGLEALTPSIPGIVGAHADRPGFPAAGAIIASLGGIDATTFVFAIRAVLSVTVGLGAAAFALEILGEPRWSPPIYVLLVGASANVVRTAIGSLDNLMVDAVLTAMAVATVLAIDGRRGRLAAAAAFAAAAVTHWFFAALFLALLIGVLVLLSPSSVLAWRRGELLRSTPAVRLAEVIAASAVAAAGAALVAHAVPAGIPPVSGGSRKNELRTPGFALPVTIPVAAFGGLALWRRGSDRRRWGVLLLGLWAASVPAALAASYLLGTDLRLYRVAAFALGIPALVAAAVLTAFRGSLSWVLRAGAGVAAVALSAWLVAGAVDLYSAGTSTFGTAKLAQARIAGAYLELADADGPVVFVTSASGPVLVDRIVRSVAPADLIANTRVYVGDTADLLLGRPTNDPSRPKLSEESRVWWALAWKDAPDVLGGDPLILFLSEFNRRRPPEGSTEVGPGVFVVRGPVPAQPIEVPSLGLPSGGEAVRAVVLTLIIFGLVGLGWSASLLDASRAVRLSLAPAAGLSALILAGTVAGRLGLMLRGPEVWLVVGVVTVAGWIPRLLRRSPRPHPDVSRPRAP